MVTEIAIIVISLCIPTFAGSGIMVFVLMGTDVKGGTSVGPVQKQAKWASLTRHPHMATEMLEEDLAMIRIPDRGDYSQASGGTGGFRWTTNNFIDAHKQVRSSGKYNFEACRIPVPTLIRYDRMRMALGDNISPKEARVLNLLKFGMPINCKSNYGIRKQQKNHYSALCFKDSISDYLAKNIHCQAILGPFESPPLEDLCFSPLMTVPKDEKRRVIVDFSFPAGKSINDGIPTATYLEFAAEFSLPSVQSMVSRLNTLGPGCLMYKRDLKAAFRQFNIDPGDYVFSGLSWDGKTYIDTRLAMGLRSSAYCCQSVTEIVAKIASEEAHVLVYLDDFGGAEQAGKALSSFMHLGNVISHLGLEEAAEKAVAPTIRMDWLGITFDTSEWTMALKAGKLQELLTWLPKLLKLKRVKKTLLQKILGNLVWASAVQW